MIDLDKLVKKLRYKKPKNRYEGQYSYSEMITFAASAINEQEQINLTTPVVSDCCHAKIDIEKYCSECANEL